MKKDIHPTYKEITIKMTDGSEFKTRSTLHKNDGILTLEIDPKKHPAWVGGGSVLVEKDGQVNKFRKRYQNLNFDQ